MGTAFQSSLGLHWSSPVDGSGGLIVEMDLRPDLCGPAGSLEGGVVSTIIDVAGASAIAFQAQAMVATDHMAISFLAPGRIGPIRATGTPLRVGKTSGVAEVRVIDLGKDSRLMAVATVSVRILSPFDGSALGPNAEGGAG
jgi:uncharacterized protein (TIGR00369 family)